MNKVHKNDSGRKFRTASTNFNTIYKAAKKHPGKGYMWRANCPIADMDLPFYSSPQRHVVRPALDKNGKPIDGWVGIFMPTAPGHTYSKN
jgi:hypothetical protein